MMDSIVRNLRVLWRAESIMADIRFRQMMARSTLRGAAALLGLFGYFMGNMAVFFALDRDWGPVWAAAVIALGNFGVAVILLAIAERSKPGREMELAQEVRNSALQALEADAEAIQLQLTDLRDEVRGMKQAVVGFVKHPIDSVLPAMLVPLAGAVIKNLKKPAANES